ncbi:MAG: alpha-ketoacid dehydrogenase subunit beta [Myxococcota bacterium]|nr:alpha-ketoacid dehydrogenase subunit beta [Myxococcota bacterium]
MATMNIIQAVNSALVNAMEADANVVVLGEDVGKFGGVFRATAGLHEKFGSDRVIDTPLSESGIIGTAIGMALYGMNPVAEIQFADFIFPGYDQIVSELAKYRYRSGGHFTTPVVVRTPYGGGIKGGLYHSQSPESLFAHIAGLKVIIPSSPYDAKGLLLSAIADDDPVIFMEPKRVYRAARGEVPETPYTIPLGEAHIVHGGDDVTVVAYGAMVHTVLEAASIAKDEHDLNVEVVDVRSLVPLDVDTIVDSAKKTGRVIVVHEAPKTCGFGAELTATIQEAAFWHLEAPIERVTGLDTPFPHTLEDEYLPDASRIVQALLRATDE